MNYAMLSLYVLTVFTLIATPCPVVALIVNTSNSAGTGRGLATSLGCNGASLILIALGTMILAGVVSVSSQALNCVSLAGCLFMLFTASRGLHAALTSNTAPAATTARQRRQGGFLAGFLMGISNPSDILFFVSFFPQFIRITESFSTSITVLTLFYVVLDVSILAGYVFLMQNRFAKGHKRLISLASSSCLLLVSLTGIAYSTAGLAAGLN